MHINFFLYKKKKRRTGRLALALSMRLVAFYLDRLSSGNEASLSTFFLSVYTCRSICGHSYKMEKEGGLVLLEWVAASASQRPPSSCIKMQLFLVRKKKKRLPFLFLASNIYIYIYI
jgi:hypothetical protein